MSNWLEGSNWLDAVQIAIIFGCQAVVSGTIIALSRKYLWVIELMSFVSLSVLVVTLLIINATEFVGREDRTAR